MELKSMTKIRVVPLYDERRFAREMPNEQKKDTELRMCVGGGGESAHLVKLVVHRTFRRLRS